MFEIPTSLLSVIASLSDLRECSFPSSGSLADKESNRSALDLLFAGMFIL